MLIKWIYCPLCRNKTKYKAVNINAKFLVTPHISKIREDTVLKNYPLYCPKCK